MDKLSKSKLREAARSIRKHNQIHSRKEPMAVCITQYLEFAADLIEKIADGKISLTEQRHGRWIEDHTDLICSVCKWKYSDELPFMSNHGLDSMTEAFAHCPHCGAKLDAEDTNVLTNEGGSDK